MTLTRARFPRLVRLLLCVVVYVVLVHVFVLVFVRHDVMSVSEGAKEVGDSSPMLQRKECCTRTHVHINALITDKIMSGFV